MAGMNIDADEGTMNAYHHIKDISMRRRREYAEFLCILSFQFRCNIESTSVDMLHPKLVFEFTMTESAKKGRKLWVVHRIFCVASCF